MECYCPMCDMVLADEVCSGCGNKTYMVTDPDNSGNLRPGTVLEGRWRIDSLIGAGGMGAVYKASRVSTNAEVAVKVIQGQHASNINVIRYFQREIHAASSLSHPHTVRVFDFGQTERGEFFLVMELLKGKSLAEVIRGTGRVDSGRIARIASGIAQSLFEAHSKGLIHRDLKPENVIILDLAGRSDFAKVLDFGVAKFVTEGRAEDSVTATGMIVGTPAYMAPERARGDPDISPASDMYALGVVMYEMASGTKPFSGVTPLAVLMAHLSQAPAPLANMEGIPQWLEQLIM